MEGAHPMSHPGKDGRQCSAQNRQGNRCGNAPILGGTVCHFHGGSAPQVAEKAATVRLTELVGPALMELKALLDDEDTPAAVRMTAIKDILDRNGYKPIQTVGFLTEAQIEAEIARREAERA